MRTRLIALAVLAPCVTLLSVAAWLTPDARGYGTHRALGLQKCGLLIQTGLPCPTCGMTTAFAHAVRGQFWQAFRAQAGGLVLALATFVVGLAALWTLVTGVAPTGWLTFVTPFHLFMGLLVLFMGGWALKLAWGLSSGEFPTRP